jgi:ribosomal protein S20
MKRNLLIVMMLIASFSFVSCASTKAETAASMSKDVVQDDGVPEWFYNTPIAEDLHYATGMAKSADRQIAIKKAEMAARNQIAEWIETNVKEVLKNYVNDAGEGDNRQILDAFESISVQVATASLKGVTREKLQFSDDYVYVLMSIPNANIEKAFEPATKAVSEKFSQNEAAEVANERMQNAFEDLLNGNL